MTSDRLWERMLEERRGRTPVRRGRRSTATPLCVAALVSIGLGAAAQTQTEPRPQGPLDPAAQYLASIQEPDPSDLPVMNRLARVGKAVEDPVAEAKREIETSCLKVEYPEDFVRWSDLNADGEPDAIIRFNVVCDGFSGAFCGAGRCAGRIFASDAEGTYRKTSLPPDAQPRARYQGLPAVDVTLSGADCGRPMPRCRKIRVWDGTDFVPPELLTPEGRKRVQDRLSLAREQATAQAQEQAEDGHHAIAALFERDSGADDPEIESRIDLLEAEGRLHDQRGWRAFRPDLEWSFEPTGRGRALAWIESARNASELKIACRAGDAQPALGLVGQNGTFALPAADGDAVTVDVLIAGQVRGQLILRYAAAQGLWVARLETEGKISEWLRRGTRAAFWEPGGAYGGPAGTFALGGSRRAIEAAYRACAHMAPPAPGAAPVYRPRRERFDPYSPPPRAERRSEEFEAPPPRRQAPLRPQRRFTF